MRVLITSGADPDIWQYTVTLASELSTRHGVEVLLLVLGPMPSDDQLEMAPRAQALSGGSVEIEQLDVPPETAAAPESVYAEAREEILRLTLKWRAHVLHVNEHHLGEIGSSGMPVVVVSHSDLCGRQASVDGESPPLVDATYLKLVHQGLAAAACVVAPSTYCAESLSRWLDYRGVVRVIPYGVSVHRIGAEAARTIDVVMAGRLWDPALNVMCFQSASVRLRDRSFAAVGSLSPPNMKNVASPNDRVQYVGNISIPARRHLFERSLLFVSPAIYEPCGMEIIEAALAGCCLILSDIATHRVVWENAALYFDPRDPADLRDRIREVSTNADTRELLALVAMERAMALYGAERMANAYLTTYQRLASRYGLAP